MHSVPIREIDRISRRCFFSQEVSFEEVLVAISEHTVARGRWSQVARDLLRYIPQLSIAHSIAMSYVAVGMKVHAMYIDGQFYLAEIVCISRSPKRKIRPVKAGKLDALRIAIIYYIFNYIH